MGRVVGPLPRASRMPQLRAPYIAQAPALQAKIYITFIAQLQPRTSNLDCMQGTLIAIQVCSRTFKLVQVSLKFNNGLHQTNNPRLPRPCKVLPVLQDM